MVKGAHLFKRTFVRQQFKFLPFLSLSYQQRNPKRKDTKAYKRYEQYKKATTLTEALRAGATWFDFDYDLEQEYLTVLATGRKVTGSSCNAKKIKTHFELQELTRKLMREDGLSKVRDSPSSLRIFGDSNAVGYRKGENGTVGYLKSCFEKDNFDVKHTVGRTGLTLLPGPNEFLAWLKANSSKFDQEPVDFGVVIIGTNDAGRLLTSNMKRSLGCTESKIREQVEKAVFTLKQYLLVHCKHLIFIEPINLQPSKSEACALIRESIWRTYQGADRHMSTKRMFWEACDLQKVGDARDFRHFSREGCRKIVSKVKSTTERVLKAKAKACRHQ